MSRVAPALSRLVDWALLTEGSTRALGLMRIGTALLLWTRFADRFVVCSDATPRELAWSLAFFAGTILMCVGLLSRASTTVSALSVAYGYYVVGIFGPDPSWTSHHMQLLVLTTAILSLTPCGRSYSVDRWLSVERAGRAARPAGCGSLAEECDRDAQDSRETRRRVGRGPGGCRPSSKNLTPPEVGPLWGLRLLCLLMASVYLSTFANKTSYAFLSGERIQAVLARTYTGSDYLDGFGFAALTFAMATGAWLLEGVLVFGLFVARLRPWLIAAGTALHASFYVLFRIHTFTANVVMLYFAFVPQDAIARAIDRLCGYDAAPTSSAPLKTPLPPTRARLTLRAAGLLLCVALVAGLVVAGSATGLRATPRPALVLLEGRLATLLVDRETGERLRRRAAERERQDAR